MPTLTTKNDYIVLLYNDNTMDPRLSSIAQEFHIAGTLGPSRIPMSTESKLNLAKVSSRDLIRLIPSPFHTHGANKGAIFQTRSVPLTYTCGEIFVGKLCPKKSQIWTPCPAFPTSFSICVASMVCPPTNTRTSRSTPLIDLTISTPWKSRMICSKPVTHSLQII